jgi:hypothetical protein
VEAGGSETAGYTYDWAYTWDSSRIATVAKKNVTVKVNAIDKRTTTPNQANAGGPGYPGTSSTVDVIPYIASVIDPNGLSSDVLRGSTGKYSISSNANTLTLYGYNFGGTGYAPVSFLSATKDWTSGGSQIAATPDTTYKSTKVAVSKSWSRSGYLTLVVNSEGSGNNYDDNAISINKEATSSDARTLQWNDDRYLWVWANTQYNGSNFTGKTYLYPDMIMNGGTGNTPLFAFGDKNSGDLYYISAAPNTVTKRTGYREPFSANIGYASNAAAGGNGYFIISNMNSDQSSGTNVGFLDVTGYADWATAAQDYSYGGTQRWTALQGIDYPTGPTTRTFGRFQYPKMSIENGGTGVNCYVLYYDDYSGRQNLNFIGFNKTTATADNVANPGSQSAISASVTPITGATAYNYATQSYDFVVYGKGATGATGKVAVAYFDRSTQTLKLTWSTNAFSWSTVTTIASPNAGATWNTAIPIDLSVGAGGNSGAIAGNNISMAISGSKIFVAYLDTSSSSDPDLKLARITWDGVGTPVVDSVVFIDKYSSVGAWPQIQFINDSNLTGVGSPQPFISYYADSQGNTRKPIRVAFPKFNATGDVDLDAATAGNQYMLNGTTSNGADESFSGNWEVMTIYASSVPRGGIPEFNHVSIKQYDAGGTTYYPVLGWLGDYLEYAKLQPNN